MDRDGEILFSVARGFYRLEMSSPFDSLTPEFFVGIVLLSLTVKKLFHVFHSAGNSHKKDPKVVVLAILGPLS